MESVSSSEMTVLSYCWKGNFVKRRSTTGENTCLRPVSSRSEMGGVSLDSL